MMVRRRRRIQSEPPCQIETSMKASWTYIGCSHQSVPSLSKVAMRCSAATKSGPFRVVTRDTKSMIDCFVAPSFQDGSGSPP